MSDDKPFDEDLHETLCDLIRKPLGLTRSQASQSASDVARYVAAERHEAAAKALREAADAEDELATLIERNIVLNAAHYRRYPGGKPGALQAAREKREAAKRLRTRAADLEGGAT